MMELPCGCFDLSGGAGVATHRCTVGHTPKDWPMAKPPPYPADDEGNEEPPEGYIEVPGAQGGTFDDFSAGQNEPLTTREGWTTAFDDPVVWARLSDRPLPEGAIPVAWEKQWMIAGRWYGVVIKDGEETWWEKIDGNWVRRDDPPTVPPPDVWEFYMRHGRWPEPDEA